jgi:hypothetical protein
MIGKKLIARTFFAPPRWLAHVIGRARRDGTICYMGHGLTVYLIDADDALIFGSKDEALLADVLETRRNRLANLDKELASVTRARKTTTRTTALRPRKR